MTVAENSMAPRQDHQGFLSVNASREMEEVKAAIFLARQFPRDIEVIERKLMEACSRYSLAEQAMYAYPRGKEIITGPSIRLAEAIFQIYGNGSTGIRELRQEANESIIQAYAWDCENNVRQEKIFSVPHKRVTKRGTTALTDPRDIYELVANNGARRQRACILSLVPGDLVEKCVQRCEETLKKGSGEPLPARINKMLAAFAELGVTKEDLEGRLKHRIEATSETELVNLAKIFKSIRDGMAKVADFFDRGKPEPEAAEDLNAKFSDGAETAPPQAPAPTLAELKAQFITELGAHTKAHKIQDVYAFLGYPDGSPNIVKMDEAEIKDLIEALKRFPPEAP